MVSEAVFKTPLAAGRQPVGIFKTASEIVGEIANLQVIARGHGIRELARLNRTYGNTRWRKLKADATIRHPNGQLRRAEVRWYEGHGVGKCELKSKRYLD